MYLGINTFIYEVGEKSALETIRSLADFGFRYVSLAAYRHGDPTRMTRSQRKEVVAAFKDAGMVSSQLLLANTELLASPRADDRSKTVAYMKECAEFQKELGGRQVLVCWGCGVLDPAISPEQSWINTVNSLREYAEWAERAGIIVDLELDPHVYFVVNSLEKMARVLEDVGMPNVYPNIDIGHLCITREAPSRLDKLQRKIIHVHLSETDTYEHTNSILGTGKADFRSYVERCKSLGIEENCRALGEAAVADIEMGEPGHRVEDPNRWVRESLEYVQRTLPELTLA